MSDSGDLQALAGQTPNDELLAKLPLVLEASRSRLKWQALGCACFAGLATWGYLVLPSEWPLLLFGLLFWLGMGVLIMAARRPMALCIDEMGFRLVGGLRRNKLHISWHDVQDIGVASINGNTYVRYQWSDHAPRRKMPGGMIIPIAGYHGMSIEAVAAILAIGRETFASSFTSGPNRS